MIKLILPYLLLFGCFLSCTIKNEANLIACGNNKVVIIQKHNKNEAVNYKWYWSPSDALSLPKKYKENYFNKIDECKPIKNGSKIMITSSTGGVAIIDKKSKDVDFYTYVANAHSIEELPNNRIAVAGSNNENGNCVAIFNKNVSGGKPIYKSKLFAAHGLVWDKKRQLLYALGGNELQLFKLIDWSSKFPKIKLEKQWSLPDVGGHDLVECNSENLLITTNNHVWLFNKKTEQFHVFKPLENKKNVKGISRKKGTNEIAFIKAEEKWWSHNIYLKNPNMNITIPSINLYKVRWYYQY